MHIEVMHVPTQSVWCSKSMTDSKELKDIIYLAVQGQLEYLSIITKDGLEVYIPQNILKDCVITCKE